MTNDDIRKNKIDYYVSTLKESYYNSSYLPEILLPYYSGHNQGFEEKSTTEIPIHERDLQSKTIIPNKLIIDEGMRIANEEIDYLLTEVRKRNKTQALPEKPNLLSNIFEFNKQNFLIVPISFFTYMLKNSEKWGYGINKETGEGITRLVKPPAIVVPSKSITDVICIINSSYGMVDYYSEDGKDKRFIIDYIYNKFNAKIKAWIWLKIELSSKADNALFKIPDALLEIIET